MRRRSFIASSAVLLAGCSGDSDSTPTEENTTEDSCHTVNEETNTPTSTVDAVVEVSAGRTDEIGHEDIDRWIEDGDDIVIIEMEVEEGTVDMEDLWFNLRLETEDRIYEVSHQSDKLSEGVQSRGEVKQGGSVIILYAIPSEVDEYWLNTDRMTQNIEMNTGE